MTWLSRSLVRPNPGYQRLRSVFASSLVPAFETAMARGFRAETDRNLFTAEIAVRRHLAQRGRLPESLDALVPEFLRAVPVDRMDGKPIRYRREDGDGFVLWSVGEDGTDDGGRTSLPDASWHGRSYSPWIRGKDAVWPQPASEQERAAWLDADARQLEKARRSPTNQVAPSLELQNRYGLEPGSATESNSPPSATGALR